MSPSPVRPEHSLSLAGYYRLLHDNLHFRRLWLAQLISGLGDWFYSVAIYGLLLELTGSAEAVAWAAVLQILPFFLASPTAGAVNDRVSRRRVMIATDILRSLVVLGMLFIEREEQIGLLYLLLGVEVVAAAFFESARTAVLPNVVDSRRISTANAVSSTTWSVTVTAGAGLGGLAVAFLGRQPAFLINSASFLLSAWFIARARFGEPHLELYSNLKWREILGLGPIAEGFRYVARDWRLVALMGAKLGLGILGARVVLVSILGRQDMRIGGHPTLGMTTLFMFQGLGSVAGPLLAGPFVDQRQRRMRWLVLVGYLAAGFFYMAFSGAQSLALAWMSMVVAHAGGAIVWVFSNMLLYLNTEDRFRGRVFAADLGMFTVTASIASYVCGRAIDLGVAARAATFGVGASMLLPALAWAVSMRSFWNSRDQDIQPDAL